MSYVIGIAGGTGSGKSTLTRALVQRLAGRATVLVHDDWYRDRQDLSPEERSRINFDSPEALDTALLCEALETLRAGRPCRCPVYDFATHSRRKESRVVQPCGVLVVEGILVLADARLRSLMDLKVFVDVPADIRLCRRILRDTAERGRSAQSCIEQYLASVRPMHERYVEPSRLAADLVVDGQNLEAAAAQVLAGMPASLRP